MFRQYNDTANFCTLLGLCAGFGALISIFSNNLSLGLSLILLGALADVFDGPLARASKNRIEKSPAFGQELDTLADMCHSVLAPAIWVVVSLHMTPIAILSGMLLSIAGATRLAYFTAVTPSKLGYFIGCPVTYVPITLGVIVNIVGVGDFSQLIGVIFSLIMIILQTSSFLVPKFIGKKFIIFALVVIFLFITTSFRTFIGDL